MEKPLCALVMLFGVVSALPIRSSPSVDKQSCHRTYALSKNGTVEYTEETGDVRFCNYAIKVDSKSQIQLKFKQTNLGTTGPAFVDYVLVFDGPNCMSTRIGAVSGTRTPALTSSGNQMTALFIREIPGSTVKLIYSVVSKRNATKPTPPSGINRILTNCGGERKGPNGTISYKGDGLANTLCIWRLKVGNGKKVHLQLRANQTKALGSWIRILDGNDCAARELTHITAQNKTRTYNEVSTTNTMMVIFSSLFASPREEVQAFYWDGTDPTSTTTSTTSSSTNSTPSVETKDINPSGEDKVTEIPDHTNSWAPKVTCKVLAAVLVHSAYYAFWITTP